MTSWIENMLKFILITALCVTSVGCVDSKKNKLVYESNNLQFILDKKCIEEISPIKKSAENDYALAIKLKNDIACANKLNVLISKSVGRDLFIYYNSNLVMKSHVASSLKTENGYRQMIPNKEILDDILSSYNKP
ncbi:hypothetical protein [Serratia marcescens]|uniref:hypothetical protein n=1 Tax=Serratia TaxID=613 RepID=UPI002812A9B4|nr:hypothetical protein [Serratia marcescens]MDQ9544552.1 hypothetical protein [Serratia marcescens]MDQ9551592.1 hypothetical protein [Serratia marcescens]MDQ9672288.1 hypothetical protein [Serratia marcescens]MDQ9783756.1 hypothetical protein [Serratia marcescens]